MMNERDIFITYLGLFICVVAFTLVAMLFS